MNYKYVSLVVLLPVFLCSCAAYEMATAKNEEDQEDIAMGVGMNPVVAITGTRALEGPSEQEKERNLHEYARTIRNRNVGKSTSGDRRLTILAMEYSYPILGSMSENDVIDLLGPPDEKTTRNGRVGYIYRINGLEGGHHEPVLYLNSD